MSSPTNSISKETSNNIILNITNSEGSLGANSVSLLSKTEKAKQICKIYQELIDLEESRPTNLFTKNEKWTYKHRTNGTVVTEITTTYDYDNRYDIQADNLYAQLEQLDADNFMATLVDDMESLEQMTNLCLKLAKLTLARPVDDI